MNHKNIFLVASSIIALAGAVINPATSQGFDNQLANLKQGSSDLAQSQNTDLSGTWSGILTQQAGGTAPVFVYSFDLRQSGSQITGTSRISVPNSSYYGVMSLTG